MSELQWVENPYESRLRRNTRFFFVVTYPLALSVLLLTSPGKLPAYLALTILWLALGVFVPMLEGKRALAVAFDDTHLHVRSPAGVKSIRLDSVGEATFMRGPILRDVYYVVFRMRSGKDRGLTGFWPEYAKWLFQELGDRGVVVRGEPECFVTSWRESSS